jgi:hypothetical protein
MTDEQLAELVESCELPGADFDHRHHMRLAYHYLSVEPLLTAVARFATAVNRFATHHGKADKYDDAVTVGYMLLIEERRRRRPHDDFEGFALHNRDLFEDGMGVLRRRLGCPEGPPSLTCLPRGKTSRGG